MRVIGDDELALRAMHTQRQLAPWRHALRLSYTTVDAAMIERIRSMLVQTRTSLIVPPYLISSFEDDGVS